MGDFDRQAAAALARAAQELADATLALLATNRMHPVVHARRAFRADLTSALEQTFVEKLMIYKAAKERHTPT